MSLLSRLGFRKIGSSLVLLGVLSGLIFAPAIEATPVRQGPEGADSSIMALPLSEAGVEGTATTAASTQHLVYNIVFDRAFSNRFLGFNQDLNFTFSYKTTQAPGGADLVSSPNERRVDAKLLRARFPGVPSGDGSGERLLHDPAAMSWLTMSKLKCGRTTRRRCCSGRNCPSTTSSVSTTNLVSNITLSPQTPNVLVLKPERKPELLLHHELCGRCTDLGPSLHKTARPRELRRARIAAVPGGVGIGDRLLHDLKRACRGRPGTS